MSQPKHAFAGDTTKSATQQQQHPSVFVRCFMSAMNEEDEELEMALNLKNLCNKISSPFATVRHSGLEELLGYLHTLPPVSPLQERVDGNFIGAIFHRIFPRRELALAIAMGGMQIPKLVGDEALAWSTLPTAGVEEKNVLKNVTLYQQELAMRCIHGLCTLFPTQRELATNTALLPVAIESMGCAYLHLEEKAKRQLQFQTQQEQEQMGSNSARLLTGGSSPPGANSAGGSAAGSAASPLNPNAGATIASVGAVPIEPQLQAVLVAMLDAVEAACWYNPKCLVQFAQLHGVKHYMRLATASFCPPSLRGAILDSISLMMQQVQPFTTANIQVQHQKKQKEREERRKTREALRKKNEASAFVNENYAATAAQYDSTSSDSEDDVQLPLIDRATASKFDNCVRDWLRVEGLTTITQQLLHLKDVGGTGIPSHLSRQEAVRWAQRLNRSREALFRELIASIDAKKSGNTAAAAAANA